MWVVFLFLAITTLLGAWVSYFTSVVRGIVEKTALALTVGLMIQLWLPFATSKLFGIGIGPWLAFGVSLLVLITISLRWRHRLPQWKGLSAFQNRHCTLWLLVVGLLGWSFHQHSLAPTNDGLISAGAAWEDQSFHTMLASSFLYSENLTKLEYPHFSGWPLGYPFLADLLAATLVRLGANLSEAFFWSGWYAMTTFVLVAWAVLRSWLGNANRATFALLLYFFSGGLGFLDFIQEIRHGLPWAEALLRHDYTNGWELNLHYHNPLTGVFFPMRTSLFGMPIALAVLLVITRLCAERVERKAEWILVGVMVGSLPLIHAHSLVVVVLGALCLAVHHRKTIPWKYTLPAILISLVFALPQIAWTQKQLAQSDPPFLRFHLGWMCDAKTLTGWISYWLHNTGIRLPLALAGWLVVNKATRILLLPFIALLFIGNFVVFQPFIYDNIKLFAYSDLALSALCVAALCFLWKKPHVKWGALPLVILLTVSGSLSLIREARLRSLVVSWSDVAFAEMVRETTPPRAIFLTGSQLTHPIPVLTGRPLVLGYVGGLRLHGVVTGERERDVVAIYNGLENAGDLLKKYNVSYIVIGPPERREFPQLDVAFISQRAVSTFSLGDYTLYELKSPELPH